MGACPSALSKRPAIATFVAEQFNVRESAMASGPNPSAYNYELTKLANGKYELKRR